MLDFHVPPGDKSNMAAYLFGGFQRCLYPQQKFDTDTERRLAVILDRDSLKWFRPAKGQFKIFYRMSGNEAEYQPDFVAEVDDAILMLESKAVKDMEIDEVRLKREAAEEWCAHASKHAEAHDGKPWRYALIPHDVVKDNMSLAVLVQQFGS